MNRSQQNNILIVDDLSNQRLLLTRILRRFGYQTFEADSGEYAIEIVGTTRQKINCILMDIFMPGIDGIETIRELRRLGYDMPIIGIGCNEAPKELPDGMQDYIRKPVDMLKLVEKIEGVLLMSILTKNIPGKK